MVTGEESRFFESVQTAVRVRRRKVMQILKLPCSIIGVG